MNLLSQEKKTHVFAALEKGYSIRQTERITGVHRNTICRYKRIEVARANASSPRNNEENGLLPVAANVGLSQKFYSLKPNTLTPDEAFDMIAELIEKVSARQDLTSKQLSVFLRIAVAVMKYWREMRCPNG